MTIDRARPGRYFHAVAQSESDIPPESVFPPPGEEDASPDQRRRRIERYVREILRQAIQRGVDRSIDTFSRADKAVRGVVDDVPLPKEIVGYVFSQIDETKNALVRVVATEVRDFLEATDLAGEMQRVLTSLSFEIRTEVRFIPNDAGGVKPRVRATAMPKVKRRGSEAPEPRWGRSEPPAVPDDEES